MTSSRFDRYLTLYDTSIAFLADFHLDGSPIQHQGREVELKQFFQYLISPLQKASMIIFLGDTLDRTGANDFTQAKHQLHLLFETLDRCRLFHKTIFILGNHDYASRYFCWHKPVLVRPYLRLSVQPYRDVVIFHGDNVGLESLMANSRLSDLDIKNWRSNFILPIGGKRVRKDDIVILGHTHLGYCNRKQFTLAVPSVKKYWQSPLREKLGWVGLFCFGSRDDPWDWNIAIENPLDTDGFTSFS